MQLSRWLNSRIRQPDFKYEAVLEHCRLFLQFLLEERRLELPALVRGRFIIAKFLGNRLKRYRAEAYDKGFQETMFGPAAIVQTSYDHNFSFSKFGYAPRWAYRGSRGHSN